IPSYARVTNLSNGAQVIVRVNDRGPFRSERIIDLSYTAALKLGYLGHGSSQLQVERLLPDEILRMAQATPVTKPVTAQVAAPPVAAVTSNSSAQLASIDALLQTFPDQSTALEVGAKPLATSDNVVIASGYYVQLGAYSQAANAEALRSQLTQVQPDLPALEVVQQGALFRVHSGPFQNRAAAQSVVQELQRVGIVNPLIVQR
ncbi:MAG: SPOR domain-containing protein, partial [Herbaspirillum sp.]